MGFQVTQGRKTLLWRTPRLWAHGSVSFVEHKYLLAKAGRGDGRWNGGQFEMAQDAGDHFLLRKMVDAIRQTFVRGELALPETMRPQQWLNLLNRLGPPTQTKWNVCIRERYRHGAGVVTYLARYLRGGPIKNARLWWAGTGCASPSFIVRALEGQLKGRPHSSG